MKTVNVAKRSMAIIAASIVAITGTVVPTGAQEPTTAAPMAREAATAESGLELAPEPPLSRQNAPSDVELAPGQFDIKLRSDGRVSIVGLGGVEIGPDGSLRIPKTIKVDGREREVAAIGDRAFRNAGITKLSFEEGSKIVAIGDAAFQGNDIEGELAVYAERIGINAFAQNNIEKVELNGTVAVARDAFRDNQIEAIILNPPKEKTVGFDERAFLNNRLKGELALEEVGFIGDEAFALNEIRTVKTGPKTVFGKDVFANNGAWVRIITDRQGLQSRNIVTEEYDSGYGQVIDPVKVIVRHIDESGKTISPDSVLGGELNDGTRAYQLGKEATLKPREIPNYKLLTPEIEFTPDKDGYVVTARYQSVDHRPTITFDGPLKFSSGARLTEEMFMRGVTAKDYNGDDITDNLRVRFDNIDTRAPGSYEASYSVQDNDGNKHTEMRPVLVGENFGFFEFGGGWQIQDFTYDGATVTGLSDSGLKKANDGLSELWLPPFNLEGKPVTAVGESAFATKEGGELDRDSPYMYQRGLSWDNTPRDDFPEFSGIGGTWGSIKTIGSKAFWGQTLESLPDSWNGVEEIGELAFAENFGFLNLPETWGEVKKIGAAAFTRSEITDLPDSWGQITSIEDFAFKQIRPKTNALDLPVSWGNVERIGQGAFSAYPVTSIPEQWGGVKSLGAGAFRNTRISSLPANWGLLEELEAYVFESTSELKAIPGEWGRITRIGEGAFYNSQNVKELPDSWGRVQYIGTNAFRNTSVTDLPNGWGEVRYIGNRAFTSLKISDLPATWGKVNTIGNEAFEGTWIEDLPRSWGEITKIGYRAFAQSNNVRFGFPALKTGLVFEVPKEKLTQEFFTGDLTCHDDQIIFGDKYCGLDSAGIPKPIIIYTPDRLPPADDVDIPEGIYVNPVDVTVRHIDETGEELGVGSLSFTGSAGTEFRYDPPQLLGYSAEPVALRLGKDAAQEIDVVYRKVSVPDSRWNISLNTSEDNDYTIGHEMDGRITIAQTGADTAPLSDGRVTLIMDPAVYDLESFETYFWDSGVDPDSLVIDDTTVSFTLPTLVSGTTATIPFRIRFKEGATAADTKYPIVATLQRGGTQTVIAQSQPGYFKGMYNAPHARITVRGETTDGLISDYDKGFASDANGDVVTYVAEDEPGVEVRNSLEYTILVNDLKRNIGPYRIHVPLPTYSLSPYSPSYSTDVPMARATFDPEKNPGWKLAEGGTAVVFQGDNYGTANRIRNSLVLGFPGAQEGNRIPLEARVTLTPDKQKPNESAIVVSDTRINHFARFTPPLGEILRKFAVGNHGDITANYFYDNRFEREGDFPWSIAVRVPQDTKNVVLTDVDLDDRMFFHEVGVPAELGEVEVAVLDARGNNLQSFKVTNDDRYVTFDKQRVADGAQLRIASEAAVAEGAEFEIYVSTKLKDPSKEIYRDPNAETRFYNSVQLTLDGQDVGSYKTFKSIREKRQEIYAFKNQERRSSRDDHATIADPASMITGDRVEYEIGFVPREGFGETITDIEVVDLLPTDVEIEEVAMDNRFARLPGARYDIVGNYNESGQTAVIFRASSASPSQLTPGFATTAGRVVVKTNVASGVGADGEQVSEIKNEVFVRASGTDLANKVQDERLEGDFWWSKAAVNSAFNPVSIMSQVKQVRTYNSDGSPGAWSSSETVTPGQAFDYRLQLTNADATDRSGIVAYDVLPHVGDQGLPSQRGSEMSHSFDSTQRVTVPDGFTVEYYNSDEWPTYPSNQEKADEALSGLKWETAPAPNTKAIRIVQDRGAVLKSGQKAEFIVPMKGTQERADKNGNPPTDLVGKRAFNSFFYKDALQAQLLEGNKVAVELQRRPLSLRFKKVKESGEPLAGAEFALLNPEGGVVTSEISNDQGEVRFNNVDIRVGSKVLETSAPRGYSKSEAPVTIDQEMIDAAYSNDTAVVELESWINYKEPPAPEYGGLKLRKVDIDGSPLPGTKFELRPLSQAPGMAGTRETYVATAKRDGRVEFQNVRVGQYELWETAAVGSLMPLGNIGSVEIEANESPNACDMPYVGFACREKSGEQVIVNDLATVKLFKIGVNDARIYENGNYRQFGDFGPNDGPLISGAKFAYETVIEGSDYKPRFAVSPDPSDQAPGLMEYLEIDRLYSLEEIESPYGYDVLPWLPGNMKFKVNARGQLVDQNDKPFPVQSGLYVPNWAEEPSRTVSVKKKDESGTPIGDVRFMLQKMSLTREGNRGWETVDEAATSETTGVVHLQTLGNGSYRVVEKKTPQGYYGSFTSDEFYVDEQTDPKDLEFEAVNVRIKPEIAKVEFIARGLASESAAKEIQKKNDGATVRKRFNEWEVIRYLPGATFELRESNVNGTLIETFTTCGDDQDRSECAGIEPGRFELTSKLDKSKDYVLVETKAPKGYELSKQPITFRPSTSIEAAGAEATGEFTLEASNVKKTGRIIVSKTNEETGEPLTEGAATFSLVAADVVTDDSEKNEDVVINDVRYRPKGMPQAAKTSTTSGTAVFDRLAFGTYLVRETKAPDGYVLDPAIRVFTLNEDSKAHTFGLANTPEEPSVKITKFINGHDANSPVTAAWIGSSQEKMKVKFVIENTGTSNLTNVAVTDEITGIDGDKQFINEALKTASFTVTKANAERVEPSEVQNGQIQLAPGDMAEFTVEVDAPSVNTMHHDVATVTANWSQGQVKTDDPAHAYRLPIPLPLPATGDTPWLIRLLIFGGLSLMLGMLFARRAVRERA